MAVAVAVAVGVGDPGSKVNEQLNSCTGPLKQLKAPAGICIVLRPCTTGEVLKWKTMMMKLMMS